MQATLAWRRGIVLFAALAVCATARGETPVPVVETTIGIEGVYFVRYRGAALEVVPFEENAQIVLRIADVVPDTSTGDGQSMIYKLRYLGRRAGEHDLGDYLVRVDGEPITERVLASEDVVSVPPFALRFELQMAPRRETLQL